MALALVVSLLAETKRSMVPMSPRPASQTMGFFRVRRYFIFAMYSRMIRAEMLERTPQMAAAFQGRSLMNRPPMLHRKAQRHIRSIAFLSLICIR